MNYELTKGVALVIAGPKGSGKSALARKIAARYGVFEEIPSRCFSKLPYFPRFLRTEPGTVIVDGIPEDRQGRVNIKRILTEKRMLVERQGYDPIEIDTPHLIFCTLCVPNTIVEGLGRRLSVITLT